MILRKKLFKGLFILCLFLGSTVWSHATPLDDYIKAPDSSYKWNEIRKPIVTKDYTVFTLNLTSQTWRKPSEVSPSVWNHQLTVIFPKQLLHKKVLLYVGNGNSEEEKPHEVDQNEIDIALRTKSIVAEIRNVPNQPTVFLDDPEKLKRIEDFIIGYSWDKAMKTGDPTWSVRLPMVKSVIRAMDAVEELLGSSELTGKIKVEGFVVTGASKRGWATWLAAAVDKRIITIIPMVIDALNVSAFLKHHYHVYGFWSPKLKPYLDTRIIDRIDTPEFLQLMKLEDPWFYRNRITVPKYMIYATGDAIFSPDSSHIYFDDLVSKKYLRYLPNSDHYMRGTDAFNCIESFYESIINESRLPEFSWKKEGDSITVHFIDPPEKVLLWTANNPKDRDFRMLSIGNAFKSVVLQPGKNKTYSVKMEKPEKGYTAFFIELTYRNPWNPKMPLKFTTEVGVVPDTFPKAESETKSKEIRDGNNGSSPG